MIKLLLGFANFIFDIFSPPYLYTLDKTYTKNNNDSWLFKEFGTHTYVIKTWRQMQDGDFIKDINPRDIYYIAEIEAMKTIRKKSLRIIEEKRKGVFVLSYGMSKIDVTGYDFLQNDDLIKKTFSEDVIRIAYLTGIRKGREISRLSVNFEKKEPYTDFKIH